MWYPCDRLGIPVASTVIAAISGLVYSGNAAALDAVVKTDQPAGKDFR